MDEVEKTAEKSSFFSQSILERFRDLDKKKEEELKGDADQRGIKRKLEELAGERVYHPGITEAYVGITEYVSCTTEFTGIIKHRFSDFHVNEVDPEGNVVQLTSFELPQPVKETPEDPEFKKVLLNETWEELQGVLKSEEKEAFLMIEVNDKTKEERSAIHKAIKYVFGAKMYSNTVENDGKKFLKVGKCTKKNERMNMPRGKYLHFTLYKENMDTLQTVNALATFLRIRPNFISYAGTKDKRAKTSQRMCVRHRTAGQLLQFKNNRIKIGNFNYSHKSLRLGKLIGNKFTIAIRDVKVEDQVIKEAMESLEKNGFINYFGLQRFGFSSEVPTYEVGKALLISDWKEAVELILKPKEGEKGRFDNKMAREFWWKTKDATKAVKLMSKFDNTVEGKILRALKCQGDNTYFNAIFSIPRNTLLLYVHSYQSLIWNKIVSKRIKEFGFVPIEGDIVLDSDSLNKVDFEEPEEEEESDENSVLSAPDHITNKGKKIPIKFLTENEAKITSIFDIVYPLPGFDVEYPRNIIGEWYGEALREDGMTEENLQSANKDLSLSGTYRKMIGKVDDLYWYSVPYKNTNEDLILSDLDKLSNVTIPLHPEDSKFKALIIEFRLERCQYATMVLREIMKSETSGTHQASLSQNHNGLVNFKKAKTEEDCDI